MAKVIIKREGMIGMEVNSEAHTSRGVQRSVGEDLDVIIEGPHGVTG